MNGYTRMQVSKLHVYTIQWLTLVEIISSLMIDLLRGTKQSKCELF